MLVVSLNEDIVDISGLRRLFEKGKSHPLYTNNYTSFSGEMGNANISPQITRITII